MWIHQSPNGSPNDYNLSRLAFVPSANDTDNTRTFLVASFLHSYYTPLIVVIGSIGNIVSVLVFFRMKLRKLSSSFYLAALGISDTIFLLTNSSSWITTERGEELMNIAVVCELINFLSGVASVLSSWFVVAFTVERFIVVLYPLKRQTICTVKRAKIISFCIFTGGIIHCLPLLYFFGNSLDSCMVEKLVCSRFSMN